MLEWRLKAFRHWMTLEKAQAEPKWANVHYPAIDYQAISYYSAPKQKPNLKSLDELDPEILRTYEKLGIPLAEQKMLAGVAVDAVFDSVSVATTFKEKLERSWRHLLLLLRSGTEASRAGKEVSGLGRAAHGQFLRCAECRRIHGRFVRVRAQRASSAPWSCPPTSALMPRRRASSSAL